MHERIFLATFAVFGVAEIALLVSLWRHRGRLEGPRAAGAAHAGGAHSDVELAWTLPPIAIFAVIALAIASDFSGGARSGGLAWSTAARTSPHPFSSGPTPWGTGGRGD